jgi:hypothetical protein
MKRKNRELMLAMEIKIAGLGGAIYRQSLALEAHRERLAEHDEALEAWGEDFKKMVEEITKTNVGMGYTNDRIKSIEIRNADCRLRLEQLERTKDVQRDVSNRQAAALRDSQKSNLVMEKKRPVGRPKKSPESIREEITKQMEQDSPAGG